MKCPFPGMDPYLEDPAYWQDFHQSFNTYWRDAIAQALPDNYEVRIDERVNLVEIQSDSIKLIRPDLAISQDYPLANAALETSGVATLEPVSIPLEYPDEEVESYLKILHRPDRTLVTVLELLSPTNKVDTGRMDYLAKRSAILRQQVHLVELDLLRAGHRLPLKRPLPPGDHFAFVSRWEQRPNCDVYAWSMRSPLPTIRIPLKLSDPDLVFNIATVFDEAYTRGRYSRSLSYSQPPRVPVDAPDREWIESRLAASLE
ncbi:MAG: DUF4058 family protein [Candidatus Saccharimonas sp.]|nr:DUF4058 family protein [Planctomycetaceae bacterium]